jgi:lipopolysaccharide assembly protein B
LDGLILEYRDPLFSILLLLIFVFVISFLTYSFTLYKEKKSRKEYNKLLKKFQLGKLKENDYIHLYKTYNIPFDSIILLATTFLHKGDYNKSISVYLSLLEVVNDKVKKEELLELLGSTYFKGGFLQRSKEVFLKIIKFSPRNKLALKHLLLSYEKLNQYDKAIDVINSLEELNVDIYLEKSYINALQIINHATTSFNKKLQLLMDLFKKNEFTQRVIIEYLLKFDKNFFWNNIKLFDKDKFIDLLWYLSFDDINFDIVNQNDFLSELYSAKGYINSKNKSDIFELNILILLNQNKQLNKAELNFEFVCKKCKHIFPIYDHRCHNCHDILSFETQLELTKNVSQENQSLQ